MNEKRTISNPAGFMIRRIKKIRVADYESCEVKIKLKGTPNLYIVVKSAQETQYIVVIHILRRGL